MGGSPPPSPGPPLGEREKGGRGREAPLAPGGRRGPGEEGGGRVGKEGPGLDWKERRSVPLHGGAKGWGKGKKWGEVKSNTWGSRGCKRQT